MDKLNFQNSHRGYRRSMELFDKAVVVPYIRTLLEADNRPYQPYSYRSMPRLSAIGARHHCLMCAIKT